MTEEVGEGDGPPPVLPGTSLGWPDAARALVVFLAALALYAATMQERVTDHDSVFLVDSFAAGLEGHSNSALYATAARWMAALVDSGDDPIAPLRWLSALAGAFAAGATLLVARALGASILGSLVASACYALAPAPWFFATSIETHALHAAAVGLCALVTLLAPWRRPAVALALVVLTFPLLYLTHMTAILLAPGWIGLVLVSWARRGPAPRARTLLGIVGPLLLAALLVAVAAANHAFGAGFVLHVPEESPARFLDQFRRRFTGEMLVQGWAGALVCLLPLAAWSLASGAGPRLVRRSLLGLVLPPTLVLLWLSIPEHGGYFVGSSIFLAALAALAPLPRGARGWLLGGALVLAQLIAGLVPLARWDSTFSLDERIRILREVLGEEGHLLLVPLAPKTRIFLPGVADHDVLAFLERGRGRGLGPEDVAEDLIEELRGRGVFPGPLPVALDMSYRHLFDLHPELEPYTAALEANLTERFETRTFPHPSWPVMILVGER